MPENLIDATEVQRLQDELAQAREPKACPMGWGCNRIDGNFCAGCATTTEWADRCQDLRADLDRALAVVERAREIITRLVELGHDDGAEPEDAWTVAWGHAERFLGAFDAAQEEHTA